MGKTTDRDKTKLPTLFIKTRSEQVGPQQIRHPSEIGIKQIYRCSHPETLPVFDISEWEFGEAVQVIHFGIPLTMWYPRGNKISIDDRAPQVMFYCWDIEPTERLTFANLRQHLDSLVTTEYEETEHEPTSVGKTVELVADHREVNRLIIYLTTLL